MRVVDIDVLVAGLGPGGASALAQLERSGVRAFGLEARGAIGERWNLIVANKQTLSILNTLERGKKSWRDAFLGPSTVPIRSIENRLRDIASSIGAEARYNTPISGVQKLGDGRFLVQPVGTEDAYRARYLIDATGGRLPLPKDLVLPLKARPGHDAFVSSLWEYEKGPGHTTTDLVDPSGATRRAVMSRDPDTGIQLFTRLKADTPPNDLLAFDEHMRQQAKIRGSRLEAPFVINIEPAMTDDARVGSMLLTGDGITRLHPATTKGLNLAVLDGYKAADAVVSALRNPEKAEAALTGYAKGAMRRHKLAMLDSERFLFNTDGTRVKRSDLTPAA